MVTGKGITGHCAKSIQTSVEEASESEGPVVEPKLDTRALENVNCRNGRVCGAVGSSAECATHARRGSNSMEVVCRRDVLGKIGL